VWHCSVSAKYGKYSRAAMRRFADAALAGVGDATLGEWETPGDIALHVQRRLTPAEAAMVGPLLDIRGTPEAERRAAVVRARVAIALPAGIY
jgi:hypothetical protein